MASLSPAWSARTATWAGSGACPKGWSLPFPGPALDLGLIRSAGEQRSHQGRSVCWSPTETGRRAAMSWQQQAVQHTRDIRSELVVRLALLYRSGTDPLDLLTAQHALLVPIAGGLRDRIAIATGFDRTLLLWRYETVTATIRFLDASLATPERGTAP